MCARRGARLVDIVDDTKPAPEEEAAAIDDELDVDDVVATEAAVRNPPPEAPPAEGALSLFLTSHSALSRYRSTTGGKQKNRALLTLPLAQLLVTPNL